MRGELLCKRVETHGCSHMFAERIRKGPDTNEGGGKEGAEQSKFAARFYAVLVSEPRELLSTQK